MAVTITPVQSGAAKNRAYSGGSKPITTRYYTMLFDSNYPTGGESIAATIGADFKEIVFINVTGPASRLYSVDYTAAAQKILLYTSLSTEATNTSDQSTITVRLEVAGY
jgi:hypothetical protein